MLFLHKEKKIIKILKKNFPKLQEEKIDISEGENDVTLATDMYMEYISLNPNTNYGWMRKNRKEN